MACIQGKKAAHEQGIGRIILETDALQVKLSLLSADYRLTYLGGILHDLKGLSAGLYFCTCGACFLSL
jgi:hypothetical protein